MTGYEDDLIHRIKWKEKISAYDYLYIICDENELPVRMTMITTALTLIIMYLLMGWVHNPFLLLIISLVIGFYLTILMYTTLVGILLAPFVIMFIMAIIAIEVFFHI